MSRFPYLYHGSAFRENAGRLYNRQGELFQGNLRASPTNTLWLGSYFDDAVWYARQRGKSFLTDDPVHLYVFRLPRKGLKLVEDLVARWRSGENNFSESEKEFIESLKQRGLSEAPLPSKVKRRSTGECYEISPDVIPEFIEMQFDRSPRLVYSERFNRLRKGNAWSSQLPQSVHQPV